MKNLVSVSLLLSFFTTALYPQTFLRPNFALKSHETVEIIRVELSSEKTTVYFRIENRIAGGSFCVDKNTYLIYPDGSRLKLTQVNGIPVCPENHNFTNIGETLDFNLVFPSLKPLTGWIDIVEECSANCLWFYGIILSNDLNRRLNEAFTTASKSKPEDNILLFRDLLLSLGSEDHGIEGSLYINIINAAIEAGNKPEAAAWYKKLEASHIPRSNQYVKYLNDSGIKY